MPFSYDEALEYLGRFTNYERGRSYPYNGSSMNVTRVKELLSRLGNPQQNQRIIHITGTKGKGSIAAMVESILGSAGYNVGLFTSPHLLDLRERIMVSGRIVDTDSFARLVETLMPHAEFINSSGRYGDLTFFEVLTVMALLCFAINKTDISILEVGLGGRYDATNAVMPVVACITPISRDHTDILGNTLRDITREKVEIIKDGVTAVIAPQPEEAMDVINDHCDRLGIDPILSQDVIDFEIKSSDLNGSTFTIRSPLLPEVRGHPEPLRYGAGRSEVRRQKSEGRSQKAEDLSSKLELKVPLLGRHQVDNAVTAITVILKIIDEGLFVPWEAMSKGLSELSWPGRIHVVSKSPLIIVDVAHNVESVRSLVRTLNDLFNVNPVRISHGAVKPTGKSRKDLFSSPCFRMVHSNGVKRWYIVLALARDKDIPGITKELLTLSQDIVVTMARGLRFNTGEIIIEELKKRGVRGMVTEDVPSAINKARQMLNKEDGLAIVGSFYVVGEALEYMGIRPFSIA